jgi:abortive infection bacteriophage resistance protein
MSKTLVQSKPFLGYAALVALLESRGMVIADRHHAERKLAQIGYYRLSGFWYPCRIIKRNSATQVVIDQRTQRPERDENFQPNTQFQCVIELYLFDKKLRQLMLDAIERIEVHVRSIIAHEVGFHDPLGYQNSQLINPRNTQDWVDKHGARRNTWDEWLQKHTLQIARSREDCIVWHRDNHKAMPFWVVIEAWDFGLMSKYFDMLNRKHQNRIAARLGVSNPKILKEWLQEINTIRNRCSHHTRIWNQKNNAPLPIIANDQYFSSLTLSTNARERVFGLIAIIWFLIKKIGPNSQWLHHVADLIDAKPTLTACSYAAMGFPDETGFPRKMFQILSK